MKPFFKTREKHFFHLVDNSSLPLITSFSAMLLTMGLVFYGHPSASEMLNKFDILLLQIASAIFVIVLFSGFVIVVRESGQGHHTKVVRQGLRYGMVLFIVSEVMFFFAFFGGFFHFSLSPAISMGCVWPPQGIQEVEVGGLPLINTLLLLASGITITFAHHAILAAETYSEYKRYEKHLLMTIILGVTFLVCQGIEYKYGVTFTGKENVYGSVFFVLTGFHGFHVTIGALFLLFCYVRQVVSTKSLPFVSRTAKSYFATLGFTSEQHFGFEAAAWYGHFVDVVGLFLFVTVYGGGS